ncbi:MAG: 23S rRNA (uracil(1939)-C(5))-methyltransferase RlmD [Clostridia bacterium]|jgi:23S rRNA (uracil1939-C5)-methyltransferase|nr:23S rRNA (uracil(1939)-C(5))-methyltransferase RlmD [Clostridia bacterium]
MVQKNQKLVVEIVDLSSEGAGVAKVEGYPIFVKDTLVGEKVEILVLRANKNYGFGKALNIIEASPDRVEPKCPVASKCGGCSIQHMSYDCQLRYKKNKVYQNLKRIGGFDDIEVEDTIGMDEPFYYRNKAQYPVGYDKGVIAGFYAANSHRIIDFDNCYIGSKRNKEILNKVKNFIVENNITAYDETTGRGTVRHILIREGHFTGEIMVCLIVNGSKFKYKTQLAEALKDVEGVKSVSVNYNTTKSNVILGNKVETVYGSDFIIDYIGDLKFEISPLSFFQVNPIQTQKLYGKALEYADLNGEEIVVDAYCGIGTISLFLAQKAKMVYGVEIVPQAIEDAKKNAKNNKIDNAEFYVGKSEEIVPELYKTKGVKPDVMVVDPPRKGCEESLLNLMLQMQPKRIVYVSCDSATLARDLKILCATNEYEIKKVQPVDMFPHSGHVETVVLLSHKKADSYIHIDVEFGEGEGKIPVDSIAKRAEAYKPKEKVTYKMIKEYIEAKYGFKVHTAYIAEVKRNLGLPMYDAPNAVEELKQPRKHPTPEKVEAIKDALRYFAVI